MAKSMRCCAGSIGCLVVLPPGAPSVRARTPRASAGARPPRRPELLWAGRSAGAWIYRWRRAASGKTIWRCRYFRSAKQALRKLHRPASAITISPRSRTAAQRRRAYLTAFSSRLLHDARRPFRIAATKISASAQAQAQLRTGGADAKGATILARKSLVASLWLATGKKSTALLRAACSISPIAKAAAGGWSTTRRC